MVWATSIGVSWAVIYDFADGRRPHGLIDIDPGAGGVGLVVACILSASLTTAMTLLPRGATRSVVRIAAVATAAVPTLVGDPTYGALVLAAPLLDIRRRAEEPGRSLATAALCAMAAWAVAAEDSPRVVAEYEAMFGLGTAAVIILVLGDALRQLDRALENEIRLASVAERARLSEELHDSVGHHLLAASVQLKKATALADRDPTASTASVDLADQAIRDAISETRLIVGASRANATFDLEPALRELATRILPSDTMLTFDVQGRHDALSAGSKLVLYRVAQEALTNVVRHSSATTAHISGSSIDDRFRLEITDNGNGFDLDETRSAGGVHNMKGRVEGIGGVFDIATAPHGTSIVAEVPA